MKVICPYSVFGTSLTLEDRSDVLCTADVSGRNDVGVGAEFALQTVLIRIKLTLGLLYSFSHFEKGPPRTRTRVSPN